MSCMHVFHNGPVSQANTVRRVFKLEGGRTLVRVNGQTVISACLNAEVEVPESANLGKFGFGESKDVMEAEGRVIVGTYARTPIVLVSGKGCKSYDAEGGEYLDMSSGIAVNSLGHGDPTWLKAVIEQANTLTHVSNIYYSIPQLRSIHGRALPFPSLRHICVVGSPSLSKLPFDSNTEVSKKLEKIKGEQGWWDELEWEDQTVMHNLTSYVQPA